jgi:DNA polymerase III epsilon subunit-like protein
MKLLVFDTETTGLPSGRNISVNDVDKWPHIIQLSYILYDTELNKTCSCVDDIIKLDVDVHISAKSIEMHGITRSTSMRKGIPIAEAIHNFNNALQEADWVIAHNISFDKQMIMAESNRLGIEQHFSYGNGYGIKEYCTMRNSIKVCKIEKESASGKIFYKFPTLTELHNHLFKFTPKNTHDSMSDVLICLRCYYVLVHEEDVVTKGCGIIRKLYSLYCT